jgi:hypothetical protein
MPDRTRWSSRIRRSSSAARSRVHSGRPPEVTRRVSPPTFGITTMASRLSQHGPTRGYLRLLVGPASGQTRSRCSARRSHSAAAHRCHWCGSHMACGLAGHRARRGSKGVCSARSSGALLAET